MQITLKIEQMRLYHLDEVMQIESTVHGPTHWKRSAFVGEINSESSATWVASLHGKVVGYAVLNIIENEGHIINIAVHPDWQGNKIGKALLLELVFCAINWHLEHLTLEVRESNEPAKKLYFGFGFEEKGKRPNYYANNNEDALILWMVNIQSSEYLSKISNLKLDLSKSINIV